MCLVYMMIVCSFAHLPHQSPKCMEIPSGMISICPCCKATCEMLICSFGSTIHFLSMSFEVVFVS